MSSDNHEGIFEAMRTHGDISVEINNNQVGIAADDSGIECGPLFTPEEKRKFAEPLYDPIRRILQVNEFNSNGTERRIAIALIDVVSEMMRQVETARLRQSR